MSEDTVTITVKKYTELKDSQKFLRCLEGAGVDNWDGYYYAWRNCYGDID